MNGEQYTTREITYGSAIIGWKQNVFSKLEEVENRIISNIIYQFF